MNNYRDIGRNNKITFLHEQNLYYNNSGDKVMMGSAVTKDRSDITLLTLIYTQCKY